MQPVKALRRFLLSCGLLLVPVMLWNAVFFSYLPPMFAPSEFSRDIPALLRLTENVLRSFIFILPFAMPLKIDHIGQRRGLRIFVLGLLIYFGSWLPLMLAPQSAWSTSVLGFSAPAFTPALWLVGIAMIGRRLYWGQQYRWWYYLVGVAAFLVVHVTHTVLVYARSQ